MPNYSNAVAITSQATIHPQTISYSSINLIDGIPHKYQLEVERVFTTTRDNNNSIVNSLLSDAAISVENKRDVFILPETIVYSGTTYTVLNFNETTKVITLTNLDKVIKAYTSSTGTQYSIQVPDLSSGQVITVRRKTISNTPLVTWTSGNKLTSNQLNLETKQLLYIIQEVLDRVYRQISVSGDIVSQIADNAISTNKIVNLAVTTEKINNLAITDAKLASDSVITSKILNSNVTTAKIADYNITPAKLINTTQAWSLTGTLALTDLATSATGDKVTNKNYVLDRVSKYGIITKDSTVTSNIFDTPPIIPSDANDDVSLQSGGIWFNPRDGGLRVRVLDKWVRVTGTPVTINDYLSTDGTAQTKSGNLTLNGNLTVDTNTLFVDSSNNRVGVGTITPSTALQVNGTVTATAFAGPITGNLTGTIQTAAQPNITSVGTLTSLDVASTVSATTITASMLGGVLTSSNSVNTTNIQNNAVTATKLAERVTFPNYSSKTAIIAGVTGSGNANNGTIYQADTDLYIYAWGYSSYKGYVRLQVSDSSATVTNNSSIIWLWGHDMNTSTWEFATGMIPVPKNYYYRLSWEDNVNSTIEMIHFYKMPIFTA